MPSSFFASINEEPPWMTYKPERKPIGDSYSSFLDELGFATNALNKRGEFVNNLKDHVDGSTFRYCRLHENQVEFKKMVLDFLKMSGVAYWGPSTIDRHHLQEPDPYQGFQCPRDSRRPNSRLIEVLEYMFDYKAKGAQSNDYQYRKPEALRVVPLLDPSAMTWPPNEQVATEQSTSKLRQIAVKRSSDEDSSVQLSSPELKYTVMKRQWKPVVASQLSPRTYHDEDEETPLHRRRAHQPINYNEDKDSDQLMSLLTSHEAEARRFTTSKTEPLKHTADTSPITDAPHRKKARTDIHRPHATTLESSRVRPKSSELGNPSRTSSRMTSGAPTRQDTLHSAPTEQEDSEDCIEILDSAPSAFDRSPRVKEEKPVVKSEMLSTEVTRAIRLIVSASNQPDMAPVIIPLGTIATIERLYEKLAVACELRPNVAKKVTAISATYTWSGQKQRLRKGQAEDWNTFKSIVEKAWERDADRSDEACEVSMLLHVDE